jgi:DNA-binding transcriptional ArsR family regulator
VEIPFSHVDLARTRLAPQADAWVEIVSSVEMLRGQPHPCFASWRKSLPVWIGKPKSLAAYEKVAIDPWWHRIETLLAADRARQTKALLDGGLDALLSRLHPSVRWREQVLTVGSASGKADLAGLGLILQPSLFFFRSPEIRVAQNGQATLLYPVSCEVDEPRHGPDVGPLIGRTRAYLLEILRERAATTTDLAASTGLSMAAVSQHLGVLRESGMVVTQAFGRSRCHTLTSAGAQLIGNKT